MTTNLNELAREIAQAEGGEEVSIAQVKEILAILGRRWRCEEVLGFRKAGGAVKPVIVRLTQTQAMAEINAIVQRAG